MRDVAWCVDPLSPVFTTEFLCNIFAQVRAATRPLTHRITSGTRYSNPWLFRHPWLPVLVSTGWDGRLLQVRVS